MRRVEPVASTTRALAAIQPARPARPTRPTRPTRPSFTARVLSVVRRIPPGRVATYGDVAAMAGRPRAWRAVGNIMRECRTVDVPCHRVIAASGRLGAFGGHVALKRRLLLAEGLVVTATRVKNFARVRWVGLAH